MSNVYEIPDRKHLEAVERIQGNLRKGGEPPYHGGMEARVGKLEASADKVRDTLSRMETRLSVIESNYSTKADVSDAKNSIIMWVVSAILLAQLLPSILKKFGL